MQIWSGRFSRKESYKYRDNLTHGAIRNEKSSNIRYLIPFFSPSFYLKNNGQQLFLKINPVLVKRVLHFQANFPVSCVEVSLSGLWSPCVAGWKTCPVTLPISVPFGNAFSKQNNCFPVFLTIFLVKACSKNETLVSVFRALQKQILIQLLIYLHIEIYMQFIKKAKYFPFQYCW